jgi:hypothetical protein
MPRIRLMFDERVRLFRALALMLASGLLFGYATGAYGLDPPRVVDAFGRARGQGDLEAALNHIADNAVVRFERGRPQGFAGKNEIRQFLQTLDATSPPVVTATPKQAASNVITWSERTQQDPPRVLTGEAVVEGGKITSLVYRAGTLVPTEAASKSSAAPLPTGALLAAVVLFAIGLVSLLTVRSRRVARSALRGRLLGHLGHWRLRRRSASPSRP